MTALTLSLSTNEIMQLSPDEGSAKAAKALVIPGKWPRLEFDDQALWGECQGSGSKPYQVQVDKAGPAFRCTCPSRKFPCKHTLALLLLMAQHAGSFSRAEPPAWVGEWLRSRQQRTEKQEAAKNDAAAAPPADPQAAARRQATRMRRMAAGLDELERWLVDRLRQGLAQLPSEPAIWDDLARRMVDAQLPGLAYRLRRIGKRVGKGDEWPALALARLGQVQLLGEAFRRREHLPPTVQADVLAALGVAVDRESVLAGADQVSDDWLVLGQSVDEEDKLFTRRVWLHGLRSHRRALLIDFSHGGRRFEQSYLSGSAAAMTMAFYPGNSPLRAIALDTRAPLGEPPLPPPVGLGEALDALATAVAGNPWQWPQPMLIGNGIPRRVGHAWRLQAEHRGLPLRVDSDDGWQLLAHSGGQPLRVFGEWDGDALRPLCAWGERLLWAEALVAA